MPNKGSFSTICGRMKKKGLVEYPDAKTIQLTQEGLDKVGPELSKLPKTNDEVQAKMRDSITRAKCRDIFDLLRDGKDHSIEECAKLIGFDVKSPSFKTYLTCLNKFTDKLSDSNGNRMIRLSDSCYPFGR
jgi:hypothetical protein